MCRKDNIPETIGSHLYSPTDTSREPTPRLRLLPPRRGIALYPGCKASTCGKNLGHHEQVRSF